MPRISVVVTTGAAGGALGTSLRALARQSVADVEVVVVGAGTAEADDTAAVVARFAAGDPRFRLVAAAEERGAGESGPDVGGRAAARAAGVAQATGELLAFLDGGDAVTRDGLALLAEALDGSGSDLATGHVHRFGAASARPVPSLADVVRADRRATDVAASPALLRDRAVTHTLFRRAFWDAHALGPRDGPDPDVAVTVPAYAAARAVDVVRRPVALWRDRESGAALGRDPGDGRPRSDPRALAARVEALGTARRALEARGDAALVRRFDEISLAQDLRPWLLHLDEVDDADRARVVDLVGAVLDRAHPRAVDGLRAADRLKLHLLRRGCVDALVEVARYERTGGVARAPVLRTTTGHEGDYPFRTDAALGVPREVYRLGPELALRGRVDDVWWEGDTLRVEGHAYVRFLPLPGVGDGEVALALEQTRGGRTRRVPLDCTRVARPDVTAEAGEAVRYDGAGFRASVPLDALRDENGRAGGTWALRVAVTVDGVRRSRVLTATAPGRARRPEIRPWRGGRVVPAGDGGFAVRVEGAYAGVDVARWDATVLELHGTLRRGHVDPATARVEAWRQDGATRLAFPVAFSRPAGDGARPFVARVPAEALHDAREVDDTVPGGPEHGAGVTWVLALRPRRDGPTRWLVPGADASALRVSLVEGDHEVALRPTAQGRLALVSRACRPEVDTVTGHDDGTLALAGTLPGAAGADRLVLADGPGPAHVVPLTRSGPRWRATLTPGAVTTLAGTLPLPAGRWTLRAQGSGREAAVDVTVAPDALPHLPCRVPAGPKEAVLRDVEHDGLRLDVSDDLDPDERGPAAQRRLQREDFPALLRQAVRPAVLLEGYGGRQYADSPRAVAEELHRREPDLALQWTVDDAQTVLPPWLTPVAKYSRAWYEALARSRYVVTCTYRPLQTWVDRHPDQRVLQTWHGAPFKRIGFDSARITRLAAPDYPERLRRETRSWDQLVSPNPEASDVLRRAFDFTGELLETGYPRTDVFFAADREARAREVRRRLDLPESATVVLYAPTFRDDRVHGRQRFRLDVPLDLDRVRDVLGDDHVLLVRGHQRAVAALPPHDPRFVRDVSAYPDVNTLLLATDVLVTDYSSVVFDFAVTGRPVLLYTYDLEDYRDRLRGFYFDVERLPGPLLATPEKLVEALADPEGVRRAHDDVYAAFVRDFCPWDDGGASARVVDRLLAD